MKKYLVYIILLPILLALSPGIETMQMLLDEGGDISRAWIIFLPSTLLYLCAILIINDKWLIPRYLLNGRFAKYFLYSSLFLIVLSFLVSSIESLIQTQFDLPARHKVKSMTWYIADTLSNVLFWVPLMISLALVKLYSRWKEDLEQERHIAWLLGQYMDNVRDCLNSKVIFSRLRAISTAIPIDSAIATERIDALSDYLRSQLSAMAHPPVFPSVKYDRSLFSGITSFLVSHRFRWLRHLLLILELIAVSITAYSHEYASDPKAAMMQSAVLFIYLIAISYIVISLFRRYANRRKTKKFILSASITIFIFLSPLLLTLFFPGNKVDQGSLQYNIIELSAVFASVMAVTLYVVGLSALMFFQNWIKTQRHITLLQSETLRQEYLFLRKQINPHFLFNVLNNIEITAYDDPDFAMALLDDLTILLQYQFEEGKKEKTTVKEEMQFLNSYLTLEQSRRDNLSYEIEIDENIIHWEIPTLMLIPIIENAVKYYSHRDNGPDISVKFQAGDRKLHFECENHYNPDCVRKMTHHGIGLENIRRRLDLIYEGKAEMIVSKSSDTFRTELNIPI